MTMQLEGVGGAGMPSNLRYDPESPFVDVYLPVAREAVERQFSPAGLRLESPFLSEYAGEPGASDRETAAMAELLQSLHDPEFDEVVGELVQEAAAMQAERLTHLPPQLEETAGQVALAERSLADWVAPLRERAERALDTLAAGAAQQDLLRMGDAELEQWFETLVPPSAPDTTTPPVFDRFLTGILDKARNVVRGAVNLARKGIAAVGRVLPISQILAKIKGIVRPLLERVLRFALDRLPAPLRPAAGKLARQLFSAAESVAGRLTREQPATADVLELQQAFDLEVVALLEAHDELELDLVLDEAAVDGGRDEPSAVAELEAARDRFVREFGELRPGEDPTPVVQSFLPAVMAALPAIRMAISVIGRQRVVDFLAGLLANLIERYVGSQAAGALSRAIVDTGLGLLTLEAADERPAALGSRAVAATIEDTVRELALLSPEAVDDPVRLEAETRLAFNRAAARNFPPAALRPDLPELETTTGGGTWVLMPPTGQRHWYKKYTKTFSITVTADVARAVRTFGGTSLEAALRDQRRVSLPVRAKVHLYESIPGTWLSRISQHERGVAGLGSRSPAAWMQLHPLTAAAAATLLQQPGLGRDVDPRWLQSRHRVAVGQRFYYLELEGGSGRSEGVPPRTSEVNLTIDVRPGRDQLTVAIFLSEREAQELAPRLQKGEVTAALSLVRASIEAGVRSAVRGGSRHVRVLTETVEPEQLLPALAAAAGGGVLSKIGDKALDWFVDKLLDLLWAALAEWVRRKTEDFARAAEDPADGVTILVTAKAPALVRVVRDAAQGRAPSVVDLAKLVLPIAAMLPDVVIRSVSGFSRG